MGSMNESTEASGFCPGCGQHRWSQLARLPQVLPCMWMVDWVTLLLLMLETPSKLKVDDASPAWSAPSVCREDAEQSQQCMQSISHIAQACQVLDDVSLTGIAETEPPRGCPILSTVCKLCHQLTQRSQEPPGLVCSVESSLSSVNSSLCVTH